MAYNILVIGGCIIVPAVKDGIHKNSMAILFMIYRTRTQVQPTPNGPFFEKKMLISNRNNHVAPN